MTTDTTVDSLREKLLELCLDLEATRENMQACARQMDPVTQGDARYLVGQAEGLRIARLRIRLLLNLDGEKGGGA